MAPIFTGTRSRLPATCTPSEPMWSKVIRVGSLIDLNGQVLGVVFGAAIDDAETGFVLTAGEVAGQLAKIGATQPVGTGACVS